MTREPLRFIPPVDPAPDTRRQPWTKGRVPIPAPIRHGTMEDGLRIHTPEGGKPIITREDQRP